MGRLKKYNSKEEQQEAKRAAYRKYYWLNKEACDNKSRIRYKKKKDGKQDQIDGTPTEQSSK